MRGNYHEIRAPKVPAKSKSLLQDESIMGTNNSSIVSKRSVERLYFPNEPHFFRYFVRKPQRRSPLINRGYWLRMRAVDQVVRRFLGQPSDKAKVVINLGCGYDPLPWQCLTRHPSICGGVTFIDIDYKELMKKKRDVVQNTPELNSMLTNIQVPPDGDILLRSTEYLQIGCDLRDLSSLERMLSSVVQVQNSSLLLTAEVSITYMAVEAADALIQWAATLPDARFCLLEQLLPDGIDHPFAHTMMAHFDKLQTPLRAVQKYPTITDQRNRFKHLGWPIVSACNLWELWSSSEFASLTEREELDKLEPFDEWEEFALFGCHYFLLVADTMHTSATSSTPGPGLPEREAKLPTPSAPISQLEASYEEYPKSQGRNRFAAAIHIRSQSRYQDSIGVFGGMGMTTRVKSVDEYTTDEPNSLPFHSNRPHIFPSSRMCHTITDIGDAGALLVGGRASPDNALSDCWLFHKWLNIWERIDDLPVCLYRHQAVNLGDAHILVSTGRIDSRTVSSSWYLWSRSRGWVRCKYGPGQVPPATYGAILTLCPSNVGKDPSASKQGIIAGGLSVKGLLQQTIWRFEVENFTSEEPIIAFRDSTNSINVSNIARFGASVVHHHGHAYLIGGIMKDQMLSPANEICILDIRNLTTSSILLKCLLNTPRPLLVGVTVADTGDSLIVTGGSAVCFSFGTFWNKGCFTLRTPRGELDSQGFTKPTNIPKGPWRYLRTVYANPPAENSEAPRPTRAADRQPVSIPRMRLASAEHFNQLVRASQPVILEQLDIGSCTSRWTTEYLKEKVGNDREVVVHEAKTEHMSFKAKNFAYTSKKFGDLIDQIAAGGRLYLRSLSNENPSEIPANINRDFPAIAADFVLPPELRVVEEAMHSSPLRISGPVMMWLHYDVMANVLCQIRGSKRLLLFPPSDVNYFDFDGGSSSSHINVFENLHASALSHSHPHEALLQPGDILFLPPLWLHTALPASGLSIAVNAFFRSFQGGYATGKDVYGNRDLQAYEKGRQDIAKIIKSFDEMPLDVRGFYLHRLVQEFKEMAS